MAMAGKRKKEEGKAPDPRRKTGARGAGGGGCSAKSTVGAATDSIPRQKGQPEKGPGVAAANRRFLRGQGTRERKPNRSLEARRASTSKKGTRSRRRFRPEPAGFFLFFNREDGNPSIRLKNARFSGLLIMSSNPKPEKTGAEINFRGAAQETKRKRPLQLCCRSGSGRVRFSASRTRRCISRTRRRARQGTRDEGASCPTHHLGSSRSGFRRRHPFRAHAVGRGQNKSVWPAYFGPTAPGIAGAFLAKFFHSPDHRLVPGSRPGRGLLRGARAGRPALRVCWFI